MRGQRTFLSLFADYDVAVPLAKEGKGRCAELDSRRNELLLLRYLWYGLHSQKRYDLILSDLENEFFLSQRRISDIITQHAPRLRQLKPNFPANRELALRYPHLKWA